MSDFDKDQPVHSAEVFIKLATSVSLSNPSTDLLEAYTPTCNVSETVTTSSDVSPTVSTTVSSEGATSSSTASNSNSGTSNLLALQKLFWNLADAVEENGEDIKDLNERLNLVERAVVVLGLEVYPEEVTRCLTQLDDLSSSPSTVADVALTANAQPPTVVRAAKSTWRGTRPVQYSRGGYPVIIQCQHCGDLHSPQGYCTKQ